MALPEQWLPPRREPGQTQLSGFVVKLGYSKRGIVKLCPRVHYPDRRQNCLMLEEKSCLFSFKLCGCPEKPQPARDGDGQ